MKNGEFNPGFRFSILDSVVILVSALMVFYLWDRANEFAIIAVYVVMHYFIFCNVTRMSRVPEYLWAGTFIILNLGHEFMGWDYLLYVYVPTAFLTAALVTVETTKPSYHGIFWRKLNPSLEDWFNRRCDTRGD